MPTAIGAQDQGKATEPAPEFPTMLHSGSSKNAAAPSTPTQTTTVDNKLTAAQEQELEFYRLMAEADAYVDGALMPTSLSKVVGDEHTISGTHSANGRSALSRSMDLLLRPRALPNAPSCSSSMSTSTGSSIAATQPLFTSAPRPTLNDRSSLASKSTTNTPVAARRHGVEREVDDSSSFASSTTSLPLPLPHVGSVLDDRASADSTPSTGTPVAPARRPRLVESVLDVGVYDEEAALSASAHYSDLDLINRQNFGNTTRDLQLLELARRERMGVPAEFHTFIPQNAASSATPVLEDESLLDRLLQRARLQGHSGDGEASVVERHEPQNSVALDNITNPLAMAQNIFMKHSPAISERRNLLDTTEAVAPDAALTEQPDDSSGDESVVNELVASLAGRALPIASSRAQPSPTVVMNLTTGTKKQPFRSNYGAEKREEDRAAIGDSATSSDDDIFTWNGRRRKDNLVVNASSTSTFRPVVARAPSDESLLRARQSLIDSLPAVVPAPTTSSRGTSTASAHGPSFTVIELPQDDVYNRPITPSVSQGSGFTVIEMPEGDNVDDDLDRHYRYRPLATSPTRDAGNESDGGDIDVASSSTANAASKRKKRPKKKKVKSIGMDTVITTTTPLATIEHWRDLLREAPTPKHIRAKPFAPVTTLAHRWTTLRVTESALLRSPVVLLAFFRWLRDEVGLAAASAAFSSTIEPAVDACSPTLRLYPCAIWRDPVHRAFRVGVLVEAPPERFKSDRMLLRALKHRIKTIVLLDEHVLGEAVTLDELCTLCEDVGLDSSAWSIPLSCQGGVGINDERTFAVLVHASTTAADFNIVAKHCLQCGDIADMRMWWSKPSSSSESPSAPLLMMVVRARTLPLSSVQGVCSVPGNDISIIENGQISHSAPFPRHDEEDVSLRLHFDDCQHGLELIRISVLRLLVQSGFDITGVQLTNHPSLLDISVKRATSANFHLLALDEVLRTDYDVRNMERMSCGHRWAVFDETRRVPRAIQLMEDDVCCDQELLLIGSSSSTLLTKVLLQDGIMPLLVRTLLLDTERRPMTVEQARCWQNRPVGDIPDWKALPSGTVHIMIVRGAQGTYARLRHASEVHSLTMMSVSSRHTLEAMSLFLSESECATVDEWRTVVRGDCRRGGDAMPE